MPPEDPALCLGEETLAAFLGGTLDARDLPRVEAHVARCAGCRGVLADAAHGAFSSADAASGATADALGAAAGAALPALGEVLAGKYRVEGFLGRGGMGAVLAARHVELGHRVAIKVLFKSSERAAARFLREARAAARLKSEHVARVFDIGRLPDGTPYQVLEHLTGVDLARVVLRGPTAIKDAVDYVLQACAGVAEAHAAGIVHRDLKPANLFLTAHGDGAPLVKVLDFGISKLLSDPDEQLTTTKAMLGSPRYMSPEQVLASKDVDLRTDVWALGVVLYELLTGHAPFTAPTFSQLAIVIATASPAPPSTRSPNIPAALDACVMRCLEKERTRRHAHVGELAAALAPFGGNGARALAARVSRVAAPHARGTRGGRTRALLLAACAGAVVVTSVVVAVLPRRARPDVAPPATATFTPSTPASAAPSASAAPTASATSSVGAAAPASVAPTAAASPSATAAGWRRPTRALPPAPGSSPMGLTTTPD